MKNFILFVSFLTSFSPFASADPTRFLGQFIKTDKQDAACPSIFKTEVREVGPFNGERVIVLEEIGKGVVCQFKIISEEKTSSVGGCETAGLPLPTDECMRSQEWIYTFDSSSVTSSYKDSMKLQGNINYYSTEKSCKITHSNKALFTYTYTSNSSWRGKEEEVHHSCSYKK